jgi:hypothetical protein
MDMKIKVQNAWAIAPKDQVMPCHGKPLDDDQTLAKYHIASDSLIQLSARLRGGALVHSIHNSFSVRIWMI